MGFFRKAIKRLQKGSPGGLAGQLTQWTVVDLGQTHLLVLAVESRLGRLKLEKFHLEERPKTGELVSERLKSIFVEEGFDMKTVRTTLKAAGMVVRILTFPQMKSSEVRSMLQYEVEKYIPFKASEVIVDFDILEENIGSAEAKSMELLLVAVKQGEVYDYLKLFQNAGLTVNMVGIGATACCSLLEGAFPETRQTTVAFLDVGADSSTFGITLKGKPVFIRDISFGGSDVLKMLKRKLNLQPETVLSQREKPSPELAADYQSVIMLALSGLLNELKLSLGYYMDHVPGAEAVECLFVTGRGFRFVSEPATVESRLGIPLRRLDILSRIEVEPTLDLNLIKENEDLLAPSLGLCL